MNLKYETIKAAVSGDIKAMDEVLNEYEPYKEKSTEKIDGAVATIMALDRALRNGGTEGESIYDTRGLLIF